MKLVRKFISYYKPHRALFALDMSCSLLVALCDLFYPTIARNIINIYVPDKRLRLMIVWCCALLAIYIVKMLLNYVVQYWGHIVGVRMQGDMRRDLFSHLQTLPLSYFDGNKTGTIMSRIVNDLFDVSELAHHGPEDLFISAVTLAGSLIILASINGWLALIVAALVPFIVLFAVRTRKKMHAAFKRSREEIAEVNAGVETSIAGIRVSRAYDAAEHEVEKFDAANERFKAARGDSYKSMGVFFSGMGFFSDLLYLVALASGGVFFYFDLIDAGDFTAFLLYISMFLKPINRLVSLFEQLQEGMTGFARFDEIMSIEPENQKPGAADPARLDGAISFENVSFRYANSDAADGSQMVIDGLSMKIEKGRTVALVGPSGGGKTTLCHLIPRFYDVTSGSIKIDGIDVRDLTFSALRRNIGIVAQDVFLFNGTVRENIAYGKLGATDGEIIAAGKKARIHDYVMTLEHGYDTEVGERGIRLSGGQKQRISIARVFLKNPPILILDEATSSLDNATEMQIQASLEELGKGRTSIIVAHRLSTVRNADEIIVLTDEGIRERGTHAELMAAGGLYSTLYGYQFRE